MACFFQAIRAANRPPRVRDLALFTLLYKYDLRASEVGRLTLDDVDLAQGRIQLQRRKSGLSRE